MLIFKGRPGAQPEEQVRGLFLGLSVADLVAGQGEEILYGEGWAEGHTEALGSRRVVKEVTCQENQRSMALGTEWAEVSQ